MARILVVDDEQDVREARQRRLNRGGYRVDTADSEASASQLIADAEPPYDVVLTDMLMESANSGADVLRCALWRDMFTEVIVLTAYGNVSNAVECMKLGAFDYVEKNIPGVDVFELITMRVERALERRRAALATVHRLDNAIKHAPEPTPDV